MENYRLDVRNLHKRFPGVYAIKGVSFQVIILGAVCFDIVSKKQNK